MTTVGSSSDDADRLILATLVVQAEELLEEVQDEIAEKRSRLAYAVALTWPDWWHEAAVLALMVETFGTVGPVAL